MTSNRSLYRIATIAAFVVALPVFAGMTANSSIVGYVGQGLTQDGDGSYYLNTELCGAANGAETDGPYLLWILTANGASSASISFNAGSGLEGTFQMVKEGNGTYKYVGPWLNPANLPGNVTATYNGKVKNAQLVVSHGCRPKGNGTWCSPGFWKNAQAGAWALVLPVTGASAFNGFASSAFYGADLLDNPTIITVLKNPPTYSGAALEGTDPRTIPALGGTALNAYNAAAAALTDRLPGYTFDPSKMGLSDDCAIDHFGNFKQ